MWAYISAAFSGWKTVSFNLLAVIVVVAEMSEFQDLMPDEWRAFLPVIVAIGNLLLRHKTRGPVAYKKTVPESVQPAEPEPIPGEGKPRIHRIPLVIGKIILKKLLPF